jgi:regulator of sirC expression with transglutaminase-like and TPR domain
MKDWWLDEFRLYARRGDLARAALAVARVEFPDLEPDAYLERLDEMGREARDRLDRLGGTLLSPGPGVRAAVLNEYLFRERAFGASRSRYEDPRNSFLNEVLDHGLGIPITLGLVYIEVARRAGVHVEGINFPGHFLLSCSGEPGSAGHSLRLILDPFDRGSVLDEVDLRRLLAERVGDAVSFDPALLVPSRPQEILVRLLVNLKRAFVAMHSYRQAREVTEFLLAADPSAFEELRDRGLLGVQLNDFSAALRDLESYLRLLEATGQTPRPPGPPAGDDDLPDDRYDEGPEETRTQAEEREQIWEYVKTLRKRVASYN